MARYLAYNEMAQFFDGDEPLAGGQLFTYEAGSSTKESTFQEDSGGSANSNPIVLDADGRIPFAIWLTGGQAYKFVLAPADDTDPPASPLWSLDDITGINDTVSGDQFIPINLTSVSGTNTITASADPAPAAYVEGQQFTFIAAGTNTGATTINISSLGAKAVKLCDFPLTSGEIITGRTYTIYYDGADFNLQGGYQSTVFDGGQFSIRDTTDTTKRAIFECGSISAGQTRTFTFPDGTGTFITTAALATQDIMEAAASLVTFSAPGTQQWHPGHPKLWGFATVSGAVPTLVTDYNIDSIADTATGRVTWTITVDFAGVNYCAGATADSATGTERVCYISSKAAGSFVSDCEDVAGALADPAAWNVYAWGDQA